MDYQVLALPNGIRLLFKPAQSAISHACLLVNAGSRDEDAEQPGMAHFIEHLLFKGTVKRNTNQILNRLEVVGADLNAYTTKEYTCLHASFLNQHTERSVELLHDITFFSTFDKEEIEKEKGVIIDEIASYEDQPEEAINDDFEALIFAGHPLANNVLGTRQSVAAFTRNHITDFIKAYYNTHEIIFAITGNYTFKYLSKIFEKYFAPIPENKSLKKRAPFVPNKPQKTILKKPINQVHCLLGNTAYSYHDDKKIGLLLLNNLLGGNGMSSRLNLEIREKHGIAYTIESNFSPLSDTGLFSIYFGTDVDKADKALHLTHKELKKLRETRLGNLQLKQAKQKFIGQIALGEENRLGVLLSMAKSLLDFNRIDSLAQVFDKIEKVSSNEILAIANEIFSEKRLSVLLYKP
ncbi:MAG: insulinase family protein [Sphingobacteriales bacterium]|nr:MAG: insulinase family protein [Sphingobacteriales bacterium]TAF83870.1 MAG: insulinase family protein [Sphingobacteriales bacterium]